MAAFSRLFYMNKLPILIDFDGVIRLVKNPAPDAGKFLKFLFEKNIPSYIISNSTLKTGKDITQLLIDNNLPSDIPAMTAADATLHYVKEHYKKVSVYCVDEIKQLFNNYIDDENPEAIIIGDNGERWDFQMMNEIFNKVYTGAEFVAMHKNKFWYPEGKLSLDAGAFINAIEFASGKTAILIGKPSPIYFQSALDLLGFPKGSDFIMIGDDIDSDIIGAQQAGGKGILIYTGKTNYPLDDDTKIKPDFEAQNLTEIIEIIKTRL
ncbi:MAG: HAD-IIA family hydrolase [Ignavibacteria bacterium]|nr:MAG: HAD-IIA family hydrolase [Ignavibacteria bacterium]